MMSTLMHSSTNVQGATIIEKEMVTKLARCLLPESEEWNRFLKVLYIYLPSKELKECHSVNRAFTALKNKNVIQLGRYTRLLGIFQSIRNIKCQNMVEIYWQRIQATLNDPYDNQSVPKQCFGRPLATSEVTILHYRMIEKLSNLLYPSATEFWNQLKRHLRKYLAQGEIENIQNIGKMCDLLIIEKYIWFGNYEVMKRIFSELGHEDCCNVVNKYTQMIVEEWMN